MGAVRSGFTASARVVTAAAVIMFAVFAAFVPEGDTSLKPIALGLAVGIAIDAFLVRMTLVPAVMALLGEKAWWMPRWLDRILPHFDIEGEAVERELALADWPEPDTTAVVVAEGLDARADDGALVRRRRAARRAGRRPRRDVGGPARGARRCCSTSPDASRRPAAASASAGHLLPGRAAWVRAHVGVALLDGADDPVGELRRALRGRTPHRRHRRPRRARRRPTRDQAAAVLRDAAASGHRHSCSRGRPRPSPAHSSPRPGRPMRAGARRRPLRACSPLRVARIDHRVIA